MSRGHRIVVASVIAIGVIAAGAMYYVRSSENQKRQGLSAARAVATLPDGVEGAWLDFVDSRVVGAIHRRGSFLRVATVDGSTQFDHDASGHLVLESVGTIIDAHTPFRVDCDPILGARIKFAGFDDLEVIIYGPVYVGLRPISEKLIAEPPLGVDRESIAAAKLAAKLCPRIAERFREIVSEAGGPEAILQREP